MHPRGKASASKRGPSTRQRTIDDHVILTEWKGAGTKARGDGNTQHATRARDRVTYLVQFDVYSRQVCRRLGLQVLGSYTQTEMGCVVNSNHFLGVDSDVVYWYICVRKREV